ncbi:XdhC family protein [Flavivirga amylovorans]|uniref:XdhC family protein n=1 Tax=Flavivirga amylovorans TaxID=870486 RepID=A0ABT8WY82_9FLAO|nr:XdhC/CoxI family protein [Flavivirga amylovorans]MDO5986651.1 XdhC family protein [Flavivirga amylovorans]
MTHEFKDIVNQAEIADKKGIKSVLASVVSLDGSSYRKPGVRMLILEDGKMIGAVSGGCVEKEILLQSESVFKTGVSKMMTYDGRYRLGCEGVLYILIEIFEPNNAFKKAFFSALEERKSFEIRSYFDKKEALVSGIGSWVKIKESIFSLQKNRKKLKTKNSLSLFKQSMLPCFKLVIIGAEHDAVQLCKYAALTGWEVAIISGPSESKSIANFPGAKSFQAVSAENMETISIDNQTAIVLMTHNFANDLRYLVQLKNTNPVYIGVLGPAKRREDLLSQFIEYCPEVDHTFLDAIYGPAGLNIGSETPQEIAISIVSEILSVARKQDPISLSKKTGKIHS